MVDTSDKAYARILWEGILSIFGRTMSMTGMQQLHGAKAEQESCSQSEDLLV